MLFPNIGPKLIKFEPIDLDESHHLVMQSGAAITDPNTEAHDRVAVNAG